MSKDDVRESIIKCVSGRLGISRTEVTEDTKLYPKTMEICQVLVVKFGRTIACLSAEKMTAGDIFEQLCE